MTTTPDGTGNLGPGTLTIGMTGTPIDVSCLINDAAIVPTVTAGDTKTMLCGTQKSAPDEIEWALEGNLDVDAGKTAGLFALCNDHVGELADFTFTPSTDVGTTAAGTLKLHPLKFGADAQGDYLNSDIAFTLVNFDPTTAYTYGDAALEDAIA